MVVISCPFNGSSLRCTLRAGSVVRLMAAVGSTQIGRQTKDGQSAESATRERRKSGIAVTPYRWSYGRRVWGGDLAAVAREHMPARRGLALAQPSGMGPITHIRFPFVFS